MQFKIIQRDEISEQEEDGKQQVDERKLLTLLVSIRNSYRIYIGLSTVRIGFIECSLCIIFGGNDIFSGVGV